MLLSTENNLMINFAEFKTRTKVMQVLENPDSSNILKWKLAPCVKRIWTYTLIMIKRTVRNVTGEKDGGRGERG